MLKFKSSRYTPIFRKKSKKLLTIRPKDGLMYRTNRTIISLVKVSIWLKKTYKRFKKRRVLLYLNYRNNLIRTYKSKNARMGKGKGQLKRYTSLHMSRIIGGTYGNSPLLTQKLRRSFFKVI